MTPEKAPESTESDATVEMAPVRDRDAQDAREALVARVAELEAEVAKERARADVLDVQLDHFTAWHPGSGVGAIRLMQAEAEVERLEGNLSALLCDLTDGRLSKTTYDVRTMIQAVEQAFQDDVDEAEARAERAEAALARVEAVDADWHAAPNPSPALRALRGVLRAALAAAGPAVSDGEGATSEAHLRAAGVDPDQIQDAARGAEALAAACPTCTGPVRETVGMVCQTCGTDYAQTMETMVRIHDTRNGTATTPPPRPASPLVAPSATDEGGA